MEALLEFEHMRLQREGKLAWVTFTRDRYLNAMNNAATVQLNRIATALREDPEVRVVVIRGQGRAFSTGIDLKELAANEIEMTYHHRWERALRIFETMEKLVIVGMHGYCLGGSLGIMSAHDLAFAADNAQLGMPEVLRGSFGQMVTSMLVHGRIPIKKVALIQFTGKNVSGVEADRLGVVSMSVPEADLESTTVRIAREIASRHLGTLQHAKIAVQMGRDLTLSQSIQLDQLVGTRQSLAVDPTAKVEDYLQSQKGGPNPKYKREDV